MPDYYEYEEHIRRVPRNRSPDYHSGGGSSRHNDDDDRRSRDRPELSPRSSFQRETMTLEPPASAYRPRSVPPPDTSNQMMISRGRSPDRDRYYESRPLSRDRSRYASSSRSSSRSRAGALIERQRSEDPLSKARGVVEDNFTRSTAGIGASLLGAVAGGWAARQAGEQLARRRRANQSPDSARRRRRSDADKDDDKIRLASTLIGAAIGGLGANALANRFEDSRERTREHQDAWEDRWGPEERLPHYDSGRREDMDHRNGRGLPRRGSSEFDDYDDEYDSKRRYRKDDRYEDDRRYDDRYDDRRYDDRRY